MESDECMPVVYMWEEYLLHVTLKDRLKPVHAM